MIDQRIDASTHQSTTTASTCSSQKTPQQLVRSLRQPATRLASCVHPSLPPSLPSSSASHPTPQSSIHTAHRICSPKLHRSAWCIALDSAAACPPVRHPSCCRKRRPPPWHLNTSPPQGSTSHPGTSPHLASRPHPPRARASRYYSPARSPLAHHLPARPPCALSARPAATTRYVHAVSFPTPPRLPVRFPLSAIRCRYRPPSSGWLSRQPLARQPPTSSASTLSFAAVPHSKIAGVPFVLHPI